MARDNPHRGRPRLQPDPLRALERALREGVQPGHAHRGPRRADRPDRRSTGERLGEVAGGAVLKHSRDFNLTRESLLGTRLSPETPAYDVGQACGTGLETAILVANKIALGQVESGIACGVDTTSDAPIALNDDLREILLEANNARSNLDRMRALLKVRPGQIVPEIPRNAEPRTGLSMGEHTAIMAKEWGITRAAQDELAAASHQHLAAAYEEGFEDDLVTPYLGLERDQNLRPDSTVEKLGKLKPVFGGPDGTMTAGNSTPLSRRRLRGAARHRGVGGGARPPGPRPLRRRRDRRGRPRRRARRPADGPRLRGPADARPQRADAPGLRPLRDPRGLRRAGPLHPRRLGGPGLLAESASASTRRSARSTATSSTSRAARSPPGIRSPRPAAGSSATWPRCSPSGAAGAG